MNEQTKLYNDILIDKTANALRNSHFNAVICKSIQQIISYLTQNIKPEDVIGYGGSKSMEEIGFFDTFTADKYPNIIDRRKPDLSKEEKAALWRQALTADVFIASPNALSVTGEMVFIDKNGNRNAAVTYGPKHVYLIAGINKITNSIGDALDRASNVAAVKNNIRFGTTNPCTITGQCMNCASDKRLCGITTILHRCYPEQSKTVILINEDLGF